MSQLEISIGQFSDKGRKDINQDFYGVYIPKEPHLSSKGIAIALADGISSSNVSHIASQAAVSSFLQDYFCTSDAWSVKKSVHQVMMATNSWLHAQTRQSQFRFERDKGYVCTLSAMVIKSTTAHIFHVGDTRVYRLRGNALELLTEDHRLWISQEKSYLSRGMGITPGLDIDYKSLQLEVGDIFFLATDGVYEYAKEAFITQIINEHAENLDFAVKAIVNEALAQGSDDNLTAQIVRIDSLPSKDTNEILQQIDELPFPPILEARMNFDGYTIIREVYASNRSHVYLALDNETKTQVIIKTPSVDQQNDSGYLERFLMEEWIARRVNSPFVLKPCIQTRKRNFLYVVTEYVEGMTLAQWMIDNPKPSIDVVRGIVEQIAKGLRAFHRMEMLHQDLRPQNIMIDSSATVKIIDFGSTSVAGLMEMARNFEQHHLQGTAQYSAPEYFLGEAGTTRSDMFSLAVIAYQMLTGKLPYGAEVAKCKTKSAQLKLVYDAVHETRREIPVWIDDALMKALHPDPYKRYEEISEFLFDLRHPNKAFLNKARPPLLERNPVAFWRGVSFVLFLLVIYLLANK